eukprot:TRINITY_DN5671_c0_g1_i1.p1 TRINITY_DN5671_c0_g1~~TRINITY_DN5671_c0_g1_i1.p1  ORF type:complete len:1451 (-),score=197.60 TRINITY_DN5671_c0_g1_i1:102-4454(-)
MEFRARALLALLPRRRGIDGGTERRRRQSLSQVKGYLVAIWFLKWAAVSVRAANPCRSAKIVGVHGGRAAEFFIDSKHVAHSSGPGVTVLTVDPVKQVLTRKYVYNVMSNKTDTSVILQDLAGLPLGTILLVALLGMSAAELRFDVVIAFMERIGMAPPKADELSKGYFLIGSKGRNQMSFHEGSGTVEGPMLCVACKEAKVVSNGGLGAVAKAAFFIGGKALSFKPGIGLSLIVVDPTREVPVFSHTYDLEVDGVGSLMMELAAICRFCIVLVSMWGPGLEKLGDEARWAFGNLGARMLLGSGGAGPSYAFIGSQGGVAVAEQLGNDRVSVKGILPCLNDDDVVTIPGETPGEGWPGQTAAHSDSFWPSGHQPHVFDAWPKKATADGQGILLPCWKTTVVREALPGCGASSDETYLRRLGANEGCETTWRLDLRRPVRQTTPVVGLDRREKGAGQMRRRRRTRARRRSREHEAMRGIRAHKSISFLDVFPESGRKIDLSTEAVRYHGPDRAGISLRKEGQMGAISLGSHSTGEVRFSFVDHETRKPIFVGPFGLSFALQKGTSCKLEATNFTSYRSRGTCTSLPAGEFAFELNHTVGWDTNGSMSAVSDRNASELSIFYPESSEVQIRLSLQGVQEQGLLFFTGARSNVRNVSDAPSRRLLASEVSTEAGIEACREKCQKSPSCSLWSYSSIHDCHLGVGIWPCIAAANNTDILAAQRLVQGNVRLIRTLSSSRIVGLVRIRGANYRGTTEEAVMHCRNWCYSKLECQYWQFSAGDCFVEAPDLQKDVHVQYPMTARGMIADPSFAGGYITGEYIQHFCPPEPLDGIGARVIELTPSLKEITKQGTFWRRRDDNSRYPCSKLTVLEEADGVWPGSCVDLALVSKIATMDSCRLSCVFNDLCSVWQFTMDNLCFHGDGAFCGGNLPPGTVPLALQGGQRLQHGQVMVLAKIKRLTISGLLKKAAPWKGNERKNVAYCRHLCYSSIQCNVWGYSQGACWVDAFLWASGIHKEDSAFGNPDDLISGERVLHYCDDADVITEPSLVHNKHVNTQQDLDKSEEFGEYQIRIVFSNTTAPITATTKTTTATTSTTTTTTKVTFTASNTITTTTTTTIKTATFTASNTITTTTMTTITTTTFTTLNTITTTTMTTITTTTTTSSTKNSSAVAIPSAAPDGIASWYFAVLLSLLVLLLISVWWMARLVRRTWNMRRLKAVRGMDIFKNHVKESAMSRLIFTSPPGSSSAIQQVFEDCQRVIIVLEKCDLEIAQTLMDRSSELHSRNSTALITVHESMLTLMDSPLNKAGLLTVYLHSQHGKLVKVNPACRVPRVFLKFALLIRQVLQNGQVCGCGTDDVLIEIVTSPVDNYLATSTPRFALSHAGSPCRLRSVVDYSQIPKGGSVVFAVGANDGDVTSEPYFGASYCRKKISISPFELSSKTVCQMICHEFDARVIE